jgi:hypothetical protein
MNFLAELLVGQELSHKVHVRLIHNSCLAHSQLTKNNKKGSRLPHLQLVCASFNSKSQMNKNSATGRLVNHLKKT